MNKFKTNHLLALLLISLVLLLSSMVIMAQDDGDGDDADNDDDEEYVIDCESDDISDDDYNAYCADDSSDEDVIDCESDDISDEDYNAYCTDDSEDEEYIDCESDDISDDDYNAYCADDFYDEYVDCESEDLSDEDFEYYCEYDYEDYDDDYGDFVEEDEFADDFIDEDETIQEDVEITFVISDDATLEGNPVDSESALWNAFVSLIPAEWVARISSFEVIDDPDTAGYVYIDDNDPTKFVLALDISGLDDPQELNHTIIHEFGHILTLNSGQVNGTIGTCPTFELDEGCSNPGSYVNKFNTQFWANGADGFVSDYASTNIAEDMAESFAAFVLQDKPAGDSVADQKINFYYNFKELVALRQQIRANLATT